MLPGFPRPDACRMQEVLKELAEEWVGGGKEWPTGLAGLDNRLLAAAAEDARLLLQEVLRVFGRRAPGQHVHAIKKRNMLTACGWIEVSRAYCRPLRRLGQGAASRAAHGAASSAFPLDAATGLVKGATPAARDRVARCAALCGSFAEGRQMLAHLTPVRIATATLRAMALRAGQKALDRQENPPPDIRRTSRGASRPAPPRPSALANPAAVAYTMPHGTVKYP